MKIIQILNNNVALVKRGKNEIIVFVKGIGFKKRVGQVINENEIERTYRGKRKYTVGSALCYSFKIYFKW